MAATVLALMALLGCTAEQFATLFAQLLEQQNAGRKQKGKSEAKAVQMTWSGLTALLLNKGCEQVLKLEYPGKRQEANATAWAEWTAALNGKLFAPAGYVARGTYLYRAADAPANNSKAADLLAGIVGKSSTAPAQSSTAPRLRRK